MIKRVIGLAFMALSYQAFAVSPTDVLAPPKQISCDPSSSVLCTNPDGTEFKYLNATSYTGTSLKKGIYTYHSAETVSNFPIYHYTSIDAPGVTIDVQGYWGVAAAYALAGGMGWTKPDELGNSICNGDTDECGYTNLPFVKKQ